MFTYTIVSTSNALLHHSFLYYLPILIMALTTEGFLSTICLLLTPCVLLGYFAIWQVTLAPIAIITVLLSGFFTALCLSIIKKLNNWLGLFIVTILNTSVEIIQNDAIHNVNLNFFLTTKTLFIYLVNALVILLIYKFITYIQAKNSELDLKLKQASEDELTGLLNYQALKIDFLARDYSFKNQTVMILDIDHFKQINDTYGHPVGNHILAQFAAILTAYAHTFFDASAFKIYRYGDCSIRTSLRNNC
ncbi:putative signal transduction protein with EAL and GGDEF domain [Weissella beninensis]|nr:diguanylate cyclase [Periweissella beninensis]MBM7544170.1 putative signal transduction protein with EAL and GGDEF domain [Periweissella beninensis]MCT4396683.1 diguanylate cyclase [Periweissella beninensis]